MASPPPRPTFNTVPFHTPPTGMSLPPTKRQRLSPGPSPLGTNNNDIYQTPNSYPFPPNGYNTPPNQSFNQPQPYQNLPPIDTGSRQAPGTMGPPERPKAEKATDMNDLSDVVTAAGVDLKAEESYMAATYRNKHQESFTTSFGTNSSSTISPGESFNQWSQTSYGSYQPFQANGAPFSQPPVSQRSVEDELKEKHKRAARRYAESKAKHLNNPFIDGMPVRDKLAAKCYQYQVKYPESSAAGKPYPNFNSQGIHATSMVGPDGKGIVAARTTTLEQDSPLVDVLALLSLACNERLRGVLEDAYAISRSRQHGSHGVVPPEWQGIATGAGEPRIATARSQSITNTAWDRVPDSAISPSAIEPPKRNPGDSPSRLPTPPTEPEAPMQPTIAYLSPLPGILKSIAVADREAEKKRLERRKKRQRDRQASTASEVASPNTIGSPATPSMDTTVAPKMTKKEMAKQKGAQQTEDYMHKQANQTAALALGGAGRKYAWMTAAAAPAPAALGAGVGLGRGAATPRTGSGPVPTMPQEDAGLRSKEYYKKFGEWREDGPKGKGIQIRDFITVMERDGLEKKALARTYAKLSSKEDER